MRLSRYVIVVEENNEHTILFHTVSGVLLRVPSEVLTQTKEPTSRLSLSNTAEQTSDPASSFPPSGTANQPSDHTSLFPLARRNFVVPDDLDEQAIFQKQYENHANRGGQELAFTIAPGTACNYKCRYCFEKDAEILKMSDSDVERLSDFIRQTALHTDNLKTVSIKWFGGEPLLYYPQIISLSENINDFCDKNGLTFQTRFISNGSLLTEEIIDTISKYNVVSFQITLDGLEKESCFYKGSAPQDYRHVIDILKSSCTKIRFNIRLNIGPENFASVLSLVKNLYEDPLLRDNISLYISPIESAEVPSFDEAGYTKAFLEFYEFLYDLGWYRVIREAIPGQNKSPCYTLHEQQYLIDPKNRIVSCENQIGKDAGVMGEISDSFEYVAQKKNSLRSRFENTIPETCKSCSFFPVCFTGCPEKRRTPELCEEFRKRTVGILKIISQTKTS